MFLGERAEALIIFAIVFVSGLLGFWQEHSAANAVEKLLAVIMLFYVVVTEIAKWLFYRNIHSLNLKG